MGDSRYSPLRTGQRPNQSMLQSAKQLCKQMTPSERVLWEHLRRNHLSGFHFRRQQVIAGFVVDFYCHAARLAVELDGGIHGHQMDYDAERGRILAAHGITVLRFRNDQLDSDLRAVLARIRDACRAGTLPDDGTGSL